MLIYGHPVHSLGAVLTIDKPARLTNTLTALIDHIYINNSFNNVPKGFLYMGYQKSSFVLCFI